MSENQSSSEINLKHMLSLVLNPKLYETTTSKSLPKEKQQTTPQSTKGLTFSQHKTNPTLLTRLLNLEDPTLTINIGSITFNVNMEILEVYSKYFQDRSESKVLSLPEDHVSHTAFVTIYEWMISDKPSLPRKGIIELYRAASYLQVTELLAQFWKCLSNPYLVEDNAFLMYLEALAFEAPEVRIVMLNRISRFFLIVVSCEEFLHLPVEDFYTLLRSNSICVNSEVEIFHACVRYFDFDWEARYPNILPILKLIRLDFLPTEFILELLNRESSIDVPEVMRMMYHPEMQERLRDLMHYHCLTAFPGPNLVPLRKSAQRHWIFDAECDHHQKQEIRKVLPHYVKYMDFCFYLKYLCQAGPKHWEEFQDVKLATDLKHEEYNLKWEIMERN